MLRWRHMIGQIKNISCSPPYRIFVRNRRHSPPPSESLASVQECSSLKSYRFGLILPLAGVVVSINPMGENAVREDVEMPDGKDSVTAEGTSAMEPYVGMEFESEEAAKAFYDAYAARLGFIMRVDAFRRSMRDGSVVWRRLVCNKEGFRRLRARRSERRKPRAVTREGCKALIVVKREKSGKWAVSKFVEEHNHPLVPSPAANGRRSSHHSQTPSRDEKVEKIRELSAELNRERRRVAMLQQQLDHVLREMEEHSNYLSVNIHNAIQSIREIESISFTKPLS